MWLLAPSILIRGLLKFSLGLDMTDKPQNDDEKERDEVLKRMLNTPPKPREKDEETKQDN